MHQKWRSCLKKCYRTDRKDAWQRMWPWCLCFQSNPNLLGMHELCYKVGRLAESYNINQNHLNGSLTNTAASLYCFLGTFFLGLGYIFGDFIKKQMRLKKTYSSCGVCVNMTNRRTHTAAQRASFIKNTQMGGQFRGTERPGAALQVK